MLETLPRRKYLGGDNLMYDADNQQERYLLQYVNIDIL